MKKQGRLLPGSDAALRRRRIGSWGESLAADFLAERGFDILARNVRTAYGELDLVARRGELLVFVEVKTRSSRAYGFPEEAVTARKQQHLLQSAQAYLETYSAAAVDWRVDVIAISIGAGDASPQIEWFENAIQL